MTRWAVVADDLTGACDSGVQFAQAGFPCTVWLKAEYLGEDTVDVPAVTTNSRNDSPEQAGEKTSHACRIIRRIGPVSIYKKIDSTLQGNPGAEIQAAMEVCGLSIALVAPAFPEMGRTILEGRLHLNGLPATVDVPAVLLSHGVRRVVSVARDRIPALSGSAFEPGSVVVVDTLVQEDLATIARAARDMSPPPLLAGSAGLAKEIAQIETARCGRPPLSRRVLHEERGVAGPVILCIGSSNPVTIEQMEYLASTGLAVVAPADSDSARRAISENRHVIVPVDPAGEAPAELVALVRKPAVRGLVLSGGDTALLVCQALGARGIRLEHEILPGIPWGRLLGGCVEGVTVATKAGGFGGRDALVRVVSLLSSQPEGVR